MTSSCLIIFLETRLLVRVLENWGLLVYFLETVSSSLALKHWSLSIILILGYQVLVTSGADSMGHREHVPPTFTNGLAREGTLSRRIANNKLTKLY